MKNNVPVIHKRLYTAGVVCNGLENGAYIPAAEAHEKAEKVFPRNW
jgi:hypothetical protein